MRMNADLKYSPEEYQVVRAYLKERGLKAGPYLRARLLQEAKEWGSLTAGTTQVDLDALRGAGGRA